METNPEEQAWIHGMLFSICLIHRSKHPSDSPRLYYVVKDFFPHFLYPNKMMQKQLQTNKNKVKQLSFWHTATKSGTIPTM